MARRMVSLLTALLLIVAACGSSDEVSTGADAADDSGTTDGDAEQGEAADDPANTDSDDATDNEPTISGDPGSDWCDGVRSALESGDESPLSFSFLGMTPTELEAQFNTNLEVMGMWADRAPPEIDADVNVIVGAYQTFVDFGAASGWDINQMASDPDFASAFEDDAIDTASARIDAYTSEVCGIDMSISGEAAPPATAPEGSDTITQLLAAFGLPAGFIAEDARQCMSDIVDAAGTLPDDIGPGYIPTEADFDLLSEAAEECDVVGL